jgi:hypothetical protein
MAIRNFTMNISGIIANSDNVVKSFGVWFDSAQKALLTGSADAFADLFPSKAAIVSQLLALFSPVSVSFSSLPSSINSASSFTMIVSGNVAYDDNTVKSFSFEVQGDDGVYKHISDGNVTLDELVADSTFNAVVTDMLDDLIGSAVTITA